ncbi:MAG: hypothetical protein JKY48_13805 [Flavobacteriales bacterium]|nr:hypothetical protein [Flavobacteriales bacterium]
MKTILALILLIIVSLVSCDQFDDKLKIVNNSKDLIYYIKTDTLVFKNNPVKLRNKDTLWDHMRYVKPFEEKSIISLGKNSWESLINKELNDSSIVLYFFSDSLLKTISFDTIRKYQIHSGVKKLKVNDLEKINWKIIYR